MSLADSFASMNEPYEENAPFLLFSGSATPDLAGDVADALNALLNTQDSSEVFRLGERRIQHFKDNELHIQLEQSVRGRDAFIIQSTCPPVNENLMELFIMLDTLRRANAARVTAVIPYYGYARQDRKSKGREPITAKLIANLLSTAGASRVLCVDLHSPAIQGFFDIGMDHLTGMPALADHIGQLGLQDAIVISPDTGGVKRADAFANLLDLPLAILHKRRDGPDKVNINSVIGNVYGRRPIIVDDMITTGSTIRSAVRALLNAGAEPDITITATHPVLVADALANLSDPAISRVIVTDSVPIAEEKRLALGEKLQVVSLAPLLAKAIWRLHRGQSLSELFEGSPGINQPI